MQEAAKRQKSGVHFSGVIYAHQLRISIGDCILGLEIVAKAGEPHDLQNLVQFLTLQWKESDMVLAVYEYKGKDFHDF